MNIQIYMGKESQSFIHQGFISQTEEEVIDLAGKF